MNSELKHCRLSEFLGSSPALTDCFTSSNLLLIRSVISDKCGRRHAERGILAQSRLAFTGSEWITRYSYEARIRLTWARSGLWGVALRPDGRSVVSVFWRLHAEGMGP